MQVGSFRIQIDSLTCLVFRCPSLSKMDRKIHSCLQKMIRIEKSYTLGMHWRAAAIQSGFSIKWSTTIVWMSRRDKRKYRPKFRVGRMHWGPTRHKICVGRVPHVPHGSGARHILLADSSCPKKESFVLQAYLLKGSSRFTVELSLLNCCTLPASGGDLLPPMMNSV